MKRSITTLLLILCLAALVGCRDSRSMQTVPAGPCLIGSDPMSDGDSTPDEWPLREVYVDEFKIDRNEVTLGQYLECVAAGACPETPSHLHMVPSSFCNWSYPERADHPVNCVTWQQAAAYCTWKGKRLPSEIEWEKAARGIDGRLYPWGDGWIDDRANTGDGRFTEPVGQYPDGASPYGLLDVVGNVMEWTGSAYEEGENPGMSRNTPHGPNMVVRGGGFGTGHWGRRIAYRDWYRPQHRDARIGFRCAKGHGSGEPTLEIQNRPDRTSVPLILKTIPSGEFTTGCDAQNRKDCMPGSIRSKQRLTDFGIMATEVSVAAFMGCVEAGKCNVPDSGKYCNYGKAGRGDHPVNCVDYIQAENYCRFINGRLPTEPEWEKAARGTDGRRFPWGESEPTCELAWTGIGGSGCGKDRTDSVGSLPKGASPYGVLDLAGNVWEWTSSVPEDNGELCIVKGGAWDERAGLPCYRHRTHAKDSRIDNVGFRCAFDIWE